MKRVALLAAVLTPWFPLGALAQVTPEHAASLQAQIRDWARSTLGTGGETKRDAVTVTAAGDHFDVSAPLSQQPDAPEMTGKLTEAGNGRWAVDDITIPSPSVFRYQLPPPTKPGGPTGEAVLTVTLGSQQQRMLIDPTFATPSTLNAKFGDMELTNRLGDLTQLSHIDNGISDTVVTPGADGRADVLSATALTGYSIKMTGRPNEPPVSVTFGKTALAAGFNGVSRERAVQMLQLLGQVGQLRKSKADTPAIPRETLVALLAALSDLAKSGRIEQTIQDASVSVQGMTGSLQQLGVGLDSKAENGSLQARMPLSAQGLTLPNMDLGGLVRLIPTTLSLTPKIASVPTEALTRLSDRWVDKQGPDQRDLEALFSKGPINAGIDDFRLEVAGTSFAGHVAMAFTSLASFNGTGQITAENIDKLQQAIAAEPSSAQMAPLLIFLKGIGRTEQNRLIWDIAYQDGRLLVNGQDMAALTGRPAPAQPNAPGARRPPSSRR